MGYDASAFLEGLCRAPAELSTDEAASHSARACDPSPAAVRCSPADLETRAADSLTDDELEAFEERLAICCIDGHLDERDAIRVAWDQIQDQRRRNAMASPLALQRAVVAPL
jgi:hypothetical protein